MDIYKTALNEFSTGHSNVAAVSKQIVASGYARDALNGITVRADTANTGTLFVGPNAGVSATNGYQIPAGEEVVIPVDSPAKVWIMGVTTGNSIQVVTVANLNAASFWTLTYGALGTTIPLAETATHETVQAALETVLGAGNVTVSGNAGGPYTVTLVGTLAKHDALLLTGEAVNETQTITITGAAALDTMILSWGGNSSASIVYNPTSTVLQTALEGISGIGVGQVSVTGTSPGPYAVQFTGTLADTDVSAISGVAGKNEVQTVTITGALAGDTMILTQDSNPTSALAYNLSIGALQTALEGLASIGSGNVVVTGASPTYTCTFQGAHALEDMAAITGVGGKNEVQTITVSGGVAGATMVLTCGANSTSALPYNETGANIQTALRALTSIGAGNVNVTGDGPYTCTFVSDKARTDMPTITGVGTRNEVQTLTVTGGYANNTMVLTWGGTSTSALPYNETLVNVKAAIVGLGIATGDVAVTGTPGSSYVFTFGGTLAGTDVSAITVAAHSNEVQTITVTLGVGGDTMVLHWGGHDSASIAYNVSGADLQTALEGITGIGAGQVSVTGDGPYVVTFTGTLADTDVSAITGTGTNATIVTVVETHKGHSTTAAVVETYKGYTLTINSVETHKGNALAVGVVETHKGNLATVGVAETYKGDPDAVVTSVISVNASDTCGYNWLSA